MKKENESILEAEVVEIDGMEVESPPQTKSAKMPQPAWKADWRGWQGKIRVLDKRWAPLWILFGIIAFVLLIMIVVLVGAIVLAIWVVKSILRAIFSLFSIPDHSLNRRS